MINVISFTQFGGAIWVSPTAVAWNAVTKGPLFSSVREGCTFQRFDPIETFRLIFCQHARHQNWFFSSSFRPPKREFRFNSCATFNCRNTDRILLEKVVACDRFYFIKGSLQYTLSSCCCSCCPFEVLVSTIGLKPFSSLVLIELDWIEFDWWNIAGMKQWRRQSFSNRSTTTTTLQKPITETHVHGYRGLLDYYMSDARSACLPNDGKLMLVGSTINMFVLPNCPDADDMRPQTDNIPLHWFKFKSIQWHLLLCSVLNTTKSFSSFKSTQFEKYFQMWPHPTGEHQRGFWWRNKSAWWLFQFVSWFIMPWSLSAGRFKGQFFSCSRGWYYITKQITSDCCQPVDC